MNHPVTQPNVYDCLLYNGEIDVLEIRLHELADVMYRFVIVEADTTFRGARKTPAFDPLDPRITLFAARIRYVLVKDMLGTGDAAQLKAWQRNAILRGVPDAADEDLLLVSNVDEIPRATTVKEMVADAESRFFGLQLACYRLGGDYRDVAGPGSMIATSVAARRAEFDRIAAHNLRHDVQSGRVAARFLSDAGWHFSNGSARWRFGRTVSHTLRRGRPKGPSAVGSESRPRNRAIEPGIADLRELPSWLQTNCETLVRLFAPRHTVAQLTRSLVPHFPRSLPTRKAAAPPVIICPYVHSHEAAEISAKFGLEEPPGRKLEFFLWQDTDGIGPERAFQHCWDQFPDRDVIILHSDMAPMPDDRSNRWYDALLQYRNRLPRAGMLGCNLFYPRARPNEPRRVQCAGGMFHQGQIGQLRGLVQKGAKPGPDAVPEAILRKVRSVDWVTFGGVLIRREVIRACGPFDDRYKWAYVMDVDYCFEARLRGFRLFHVPVALQHQAGRTTRALWEADPKLQEHFLRNYEAFYDKWGAFSAALSGKHKSVDIKVGEEAFFRWDGRGADFLAGGWSRPEDWGVWSNGSVAKLGFRLTPRPAGAIVLCLRLNAFIPVPGSTREVAVSIADKQVARWRFDSVNCSGERRLVIDRDMTTPDGKLRLEFYIPRPESPAEFGLSADVRKLGIGLVSLVLETGN